MGYLPPASFVSSETHHRQRVQIEEWLIAVIAAVVNDNVTAVCLQAVVIRK
jgi:hypothetical protein